MKGGYIMAKIVNSKSEIILDDPDEFPEGALLTYLDRKEIAYTLYHDPLEYLKNVWQGSDLCSMKLVDFAKEFSAIGNMNADGDELLDVYGVDFITTIPADIQDSSNKIACEFYSKALQSITGKQLYITDTEE